MSDSIDDRVVSMQFENNDFSRKVNDTIKNLDALNKSLDMSGSKRGLEELSNAGQNFRLDGISNAVEGVSGKFLALTTIGITALATITERAVSAGLQFAKSFTFAPIMDGFHEFETNMDSIQTILSNTKSKGSTLDDVNKSLDELNTYSDKTIYNFTQMAHNIGTFTAAGVDLKTSTASIKGIANLAALSGSSADQASTAMYQLSQAIASGSVKLMDWNSVVNAGMGGETFQKALFESGKAMKTLKDVPMGETFEQWKKKGNSFRDSLQDGWITTEVLTKTLNSFSGDLTKDQIKALGYSDAQAQSLYEMGQTGLTAATQVKTLTQLVGTVKEAVGSGWTKTFQILFGNFGESVQLFTEINNVIGKMVGNSANARNSLLQGWKDLGGRELLIQTVRDAFAALGKIVSIVKESFREIFPAKTSKDLLNITRAVLNFVQALYPGPKTIQDLRGVFLGLFAALDIVKEVVKGLFIVFKTLFSSFSGAGSGILHLVGEFGQWIQLQDALLVNSGKMQKFFEKLASYVKMPIPAIKELVDHIVHFFETFGKSKDVEAAANRVTQRFSGLSVVSERLSSVWDRLSGISQKIIGILDKVWGYVSKWLHDLGKNMAAALAPGDFNAAVDVLNVGLLGGIVLLLKKFLDGGFNVDFGNGLLDKVSKALDGVTGTLKSMQTQIKADALLKIAIALGILTVSIVALSLIDSGALAKALTAMTVGFGELLGTMAAMDKVVGSAGSAGKLGLVALALIGLSTAMLILSAAIKNLSGLSWGELAKGLVGVAIGLGLLLVAAQLMASSSVSMIAAGIGMAAMAFALNLLGLAVKVFATMSWGEMAKGLVGVGAALLIITAAMNFMPPVEILAAGLAMIPLATGLTILAGAVAAMGAIKFGTMAKGIGAIAVLLLILGAAMQEMPITMPIIAVGLVILATALAGMAAAVALMGAIKFGTMAKGIGGIAVLLLILTAAMEGMQGALPGAAALIVTAGALTILAEVVEKMGKMKIKDLATGIGAVAVVLGVLGISAALLQPVIPAMLAMGIALGIIGGSFALFGLGAILVAKSFQVMAVSGKAGVTAIIDVIKTLLAALPSFVQILVDDIGKMGENLLQAATLLLKMITVFLSQVLDTIIQLAPKIAIALVEVITLALILIQAKFPEFVTTGILMLLSLLAGIKQNISLITQQAVDIIVSFAETLTNNQQRLVDAAVNLILGFLTAIENRMNDIDAAGLNLLLAFIGGVVNNIARVIEMGGKIIASLVTGIANAVGRVADAGADALVQFLGRINADLYKVTNAAADVIITFIQAIGNNSLRVVNAAADVIIDFLNGLANSIRDHSAELRQAGLNIASAILDGMTAGLASKAHNVAEGALNVAKGAVGAVTGFLRSNSPSKLFMDIGSNMALGMAIGLDKDISAENSAVAHAERIVSAFQQTLNRIPDSLNGMNELNPIISPVLDLTQVRSAASGLDAMLSTSEINAQVSVGHAGLISNAFSQNGSDSVDAAAVVPSEVKFIQNNYSPRALATTDIYRQTKSQFAMVKRELNI